MKNNKGFTLLEIVVSIALLGIISVGFLSIFGSQFKMIFNTRYLTSDVFAAQKDMENTINDVQETIQNGATPAGASLQSFTLFDEMGSTYRRTVSGYPRTDPIGAGGENSLYTVIADTVMPEFPVASAVISAGFSDNKLIAADNSKSSLYAKTTVTLTDPGGVNMANIYRWYVSRPGFYIPMITAPEEIEKGKKYPIFPNDYSVIAGATGTTLTGISNYPGSNLICTVTPAAKSGKMGETAVSNLLYVPGLTVTDGLVLHLDASLISKESTTAVRADGSTYYVKNWSDISGSGLSATPANNSLQPELVEESSGSLIYNGVRCEIWVKLLRFDSDDLMSISPAGLTDTATIFAVGKEGSAFVIYDNVTCPSYLKIDAGQVNLGSNCEIAELLIYNRALEPDEFVAVTKYLSDKYQPTAPPVSIYSLQSITATVLKGDPYTMPSTVIAYMDDGTTQIVSVAWSGTVDTNTPGLQEFTGTVSGTAKTASLKVTVLDLSIISLENITVTVEQGTAYTMPSKVVATLSDGTKMDINVTWSPLSVSTAAIGTQYSTGTAVADSSKSMLLTVNVVGKPASGISLNKSVLELAVGNSETLIATVTPDDASDKSVEWSSDNSAVATVDAGGNVTAIAEGTAVITATTKDGSNLSASCTVTVKPVAVTGVTLDQTSVTLSKNGTAVIAATVLPANAANQNVTWSSSNTSVVTVSGSGLSATVTAKKGGKATITVTTVDGGKTAACVVYVRPYATEITRVNSRSFQVTFDSPVTSATVTYGATTKTGSISGTVVTFSSSDVFPSGSGGTTYTITVSNSDGITSTVTATYTRTGYYYYTYTWTIVSQS